MENLHSIFTDTNLNEVFDTSKADDFFEALYGSKEEGAYDIVLKFKDKIDNSSLLFEFNLIRRKNKCLACSLTYGLPQVFMRHPIIDLEGIARKVVEKLGENILLESWQTQRTKEISSNLHIIPFIINLKNSGDTLTR